MELISMILEEMQRELGRQSIRCPTENVDVPDEKGKDDARERYKQLHSDYKIMSDQLDAFAREKAKAPWRRGQGQGELEVARARARIQDLEAEVKVLQARCDDYQAQASQLAQDLQMLYIEIEDVRQKNKALQSEIDSIEQRYRKASQPIQDLEMLNKELNQKNTVLQSEIDSIEQRYRKASQPIQDLEMLNEELSQKNKALRLEIEDLKENNGTLRCEVNSLEEKYANARRMAAQFRIKIEESFGLASHRILIPHYYEEITSKISHLVSKYLNTAPKERPKEQNQRRQRDVSLSKIWDENLSDHEKESRCMAAIFEFLNDEILLKPAFGLEDDDEDGTLERGLVEFETRLRACPEDSIEFALKNNWVNLTLESVEKIRKKGPGSKPYSLASDLEKFLRPVSKRIDGNLSGELLELCKTAFDLNWSMRSEYQFEFQFYSLEPGTVPEELPKVKTPGTDVEVNPQPRILEYLAVERGYPEHLTRTVAYTIFGGLSCIVTNKDEYNPIMVPAKVCFKVV
ncbi:e367b33a-5e08-490f-ae21-6f24e5379990 [Sclerotinia trifoliorum]|uniref:E367b33a-5e08-490f-ae21-6f24e5379990 n=1 Tax=Sclerotinia trifoliorum TaxID=28548 RepID=A0A8H2ZPV2_9HELO|nr:e367b33a-5e08-490f-ae21-6f24e5379990 [Sclerotinia trifoliorum]